MCNDKTTKTNLRVLVRLNPNKGDVSRLQEYRNIKLVSLAENLFKLYSKNYTYKNYKYLYKN